MSIVPMPDAYRMAGAVEHVVGNQSRTGQETLSRLWDLLDDPHLYKAEVAAVALTENADPVRTQVAHAREFVARSAR